MITISAKLKYYYGSFKYLEQLEHWLLGQSTKEKQQAYEDQRKEWRKLHNIPDKMNVKGSTVKRYNT